MNVLFLNNEGVINIYPLLTWLIWLPSKTCFSILKRPCWFGMKKWWHETALWNCQGLSLSSEFVRNDCASAFSWFWAHARILFCLRCGWPHLFESLGRSTVRIWREVIQAKITSRLLTTTHLLWLIYLSTSLAPLCCIIYNYTSRTLSNLCNGCSAMTWGPKTLFIENYGVTRVWN